MSDAVQQIDTSTAKCERSAVFLRGEGDQDNAAQFHLIADRLLALAAERDALRQDARRYQWLKANLTCDADDYECFMGLRGKFRTDECPMDLDAAIDAELERA